MSPGTRRSILRWIHILFGATLFGYIYGPPEEVQQYAPFFRFVFFPVLVLSGLWLWKGPALWRLASKGAAGRGASSSIESPQG